MKLTTYILLLSSLNLSCQKLSSLGSKCIEIAQEDIPLKIEEPGHYCLQENIHFSDPLPNKLDKTLIKLSFKEESSHAAIKINGTKNVVLDFNSYRISTDLDLSKVSYGVFVHNSNNVQIKNGSITNMFYGIIGDGINKEIAISDFIFKSNTFRAIGIKSDKVTVLNTSIKETGGTKVYDDSFAMGIEIKGGNCIIKNNTISETKAVGIGESIALSLSVSPDGCIVEGNKFSGVDSQSPYSQSFGLWYDINSNIKVIDNDFKNFTHAYVFPTNNDSVFSNNRVEKIDCLGEKFGSPINKMQRSVSHKLQPITKENCPADLAFWENKPEHPYKDFKIGVIYANSGQHCKAIEYYQKAYKKGVKEAGRLTKMINRFLKPKC